MNGPTYDILQHYILEHDDLGTNTCSIYQWLVLPSRNIEIVFITVPGLNQRVAYHDKVCEPRSDPVKMERCP